MRYRIIANVLRGRSLYVLALTCLPLPALQAQTSIAALAPVGMPSPVVFSSIATLVEVGDGRALINDPAARRVVLLNRDLTLARVVLDSAAGVDNSYGHVPGGLLPYRGDSALFVDAASRALLIIAPTGDRAGVRALPPSIDPQALSTPTRGGAAFDSEARLVYLQPPARIDERTLLSALGTVNAVHDSAALVRYDFTSRSIDTIAFLRVQGLRLAVSATSDGNRSVLREINPTFVADDWALMSDGVVAVVRGQRYQVEWKGAGARGQRPVAIPFSWSRYSEDDKRDMLDSARAREEQRASAQRAAGRVMRDGPTFVLAPLSEVLDFRPAFGVGGTRADRVGRLWIRTTTEATPGRVRYDVIDRVSNSTVQRSLARDVNIAGFGREGRIYLAKRDSAGVRLFLVK